MIPDYQTLMLPVLQTAANSEISTKQVVELLAEEFSLSEDEREELLPSGRQRRFDNRVAWAKGYLKQAGLVTYTKRGFFIATDKGRQVLSTGPQRIDNEFLSQFSAFQDFRSRTGTMTEKRLAEAPLPAEQEHHSTPDEVLREAYTKINASLADDLLERVRNASPTFFEELIIELLLGMGYGGTSKEAGHALGRSGDNGVDGVIDQDPLGVDQIYVQAKRYAEGNNVGAGELRDFFGALHLKKATKGIFFTTSSFSPAATQTAKDLGLRIVLIDGQKLAALMIRYNIGCRTEEVLHLKKVDEDFFG